MQYERNDQDGGMSDHQKFAETGSFGNAASPAADHVGEAASEVHDRVDQTAGTVRDRAGQLKAQVADKLETGAERLRQRTTNTSKLDDAVAATKEKVAGASDRVATGMERTADWLRGTDMSSIQRGLEKQVKENPGRTLLIAAGIGYLIGRALKGKES
jgi:ElaB/YqjD/DUF883 family membrane-anchored ribosome-binding protein